MVTTQYPREVAYQYTTKRQMKLIDLNEKTGEFRATWVGEEH